VAAIPRPTETATAADRAFTRSASASQGPDLVVGLLLRPYGAVLMGFGLQTGNRTAENPVNARTGRRRPENPVDATTGGSRSQRWSHGRLPRRVPAAVPLPGWSTATRLRVSSS